MIIRALFESVLHVKVCAYVLTVAADDDDADDLFDVV